jgi:hypothetical protein
MSLERRAKEFAKGSLSPATQERLKAAYRRWKGPRAPSRLKPAPSDPHGAARHAALTAHASGRTVDHVRARRAAGRWFLADGTWRHPGAALPAGTADAPTLTLLGPIPPDDGSSGPAAPLDLEGLVLALPGAPAYDGAEPVLPGAGVLLDTLGDHERVGVLAAAIALHLGARPVSGIRIHPADDPVLAALRRSLTATEGER